MSATFGRCVILGCPHFATDDNNRCWKHTPAPVVMAAEFEAVRVDPTTDRDRWDDFTDGGLEQPGGGDEW